MEVDIKDRTIAGFVPTVKAGETISPRVSYGLQGKKRNLGIDPALASRLDKIAQLTGDDVSVVVSSGGQFSKAQIARGARGRRTGSPRHNINAQGVSEAADIFLLRNGNQITPTNDPRTYLQFAQNAAAEDPGLGFGHYAWGLHIDNKGGAWGPNTRSATLNPTFDRALRRGRSGQRTRTLVAPQVVAANLNAGTDQPRSASPLEQVGQADPILEFARVSSLGEAGTDDLRKSSLQIAKDTSGSRSYGFLGINSMTGSAAKFSRDNPGLGLTATPGTEAFNRQWLQAANSNPQGLVDAQLKFLRNDVVKPGINALKATGLERFSNDPRALAFVSDAVVQYGAGGVKSHLQAAGSAEDVESFIKTAAQSMLRNRKRNFRTYLSQNPQNEKGLINRINGRVERALSLGASIGAAKAASFTPPRGPGEPRPDIEDLPAASAPISINTNGRDAESDVLSTVDTSDRQDVIDRYRLAQEAEDVDQDFLSDVEDFGTQFIEQQSITGILRSIGNASEADPSFRLESDRVISELRKANLSPGRFGASFDNVRSEEQFQTALQEAVATNEREQRLGFGGTITASLASALLDPVALGAEALTLGAAAPVTRGLQLGRLGRIGVTAAQGAAAAAAGEVAVGAVNGNIDGDDVLTTAVIGASLGGVVGALARNPALQSEAASVQRLADNLQNGTAAGGSSAGAAQVGTIQRIIDEDKAFQAIQDGDVARGFAAPVRFSTIGRLKGSDNPLVRLIFGGLAKDGAGANGDEVLAFSPSETLEQLTSEFDTKYKRVLTNQLNTYVKNNAEQGAGHAELTQRFNEEVADFIEDVSEDATAKYDPEVVKVGEVIRQNHRDLLKLANNPRLREGDTARPVKGFDEIQDDPHYLTRVWDSNKLKQIREEYGDTTIERLIEKGIKRQLSDLEPAKAKAVSRAFTKAITDRALGFDDVASTPISVDSIDEITDILKESGGLSAEDADALLKKFRPTGDGGRVTSAKRRLLLDISTELDPSDATRLDGAIPDKPLRLKDLLVRDSNYLHQRYTRQISGRIALAKYRVHDPKTGDLIVDGITSDADFAGLVRGIKKRGVALGIDQKKTNKDVERAQFLYDYLTGKPRGTTPGSTADKVLEGLLKFNFVRAFNQVGFAQIPEIANVLHGAGIKAALSHIPNFRRVVQESTGEELLENGLARDLENFLFDGTDRVRNTVGQRFDDLSGEPVSLRSGSLGDRALNALDRGSQITADISLLNGVNAALTRWTSKAIVQNFVDAAHSGSKRLDSHRLRTLGLSDEMAERVFKELRNPDNVTTEKGTLTGRRVTRLNTDAWADREALEAFRDAAWRQGRTIIQRNDVGLLHEWMSTPTGRIVAQFRSFAIGAYENGLLLNLNRVRNGDMAAFGWFLTSAALAGLTRAAQVQITSIGRSDRAEYLERELSTERLAAASIGRSGYSSILPMLLDSTVSTPLTGQPLFDFRTTTQSSNLLFGNPSFDLIDSIGNLTKAVTRPVIEGREISQQEIKSATRALPFANFVPFVLLLNSMTSELPERAPRFSN